MIDFLQNETEFVERYSGKRITITGEIFSKSTPKDNMPEKDFNYIVFQDSKNNDIEIGVLCYFDEFVYWEVNERQTIIVEGNFRIIDYIRDYDTGNIVKKYIVLGECKIMGHGI